MTPIRILNSALSDDAKHLWLPCARWGSVNGQLFSTNLEEFIGAMKAELDFNHAKILRLTEEITRAGLHPEVYARKETFDEPAAVTKFRTVRLLKVLGCLDGERQPV